MVDSKRTAAQRLYLYLAALFITSLVVSNLIFQKFFYWYPLDWEIMGNSLFELSVGILPYPITFLVTDLISEIYGKKAANRVVVAGIFASFFSMGILLIAGLVPTLPNSPIDDQTFNQVFALSPIAVLASMMAYLLAQFIDIRIYHFWKNLTKGRHLWLRNNFSTFASQFVDTFTVVGLLCAFGVLPWDAFVGLVISGVVFKILVALIDTPLLYLSVGWIRSYFKLEINEEIKL
ncbi:MAG: queuosine precursor transporter [Flavobacteriaceae bacterium]|nr:queuosine precursor transporter [Flavobacteriaceae bacterium]